MIEQIKSKIDWIFSDLEFEEESHRYFVNGTPFPSVSTLIKKHETFVDFKAIKKAIAKRDNVTEENLTVDWDKKKNDACALGTKTHNYAEFYDGTQIPENGFQEAAKKFFDELPEYYVVLYKELRMYHREFKYAGTADLILLDTRTNSLVIADFKTNKDLWKAYQNLLGSFSHLEQNNFNKYQLQLSYYQIILEESFYPVTNRFIVWLRPEGNYEIHNTTDLTKELRYYILNN
jgi:hypothetical protein